MNVSKEAREDAVTQGDRDAADPFTKDNFADLWRAFTDCDYELIEDVGAFTADIERLGLAALVEVDDDALNDAFASERGIEPGGLCWRLTAAGHARYAAAIRQMIGGKA